MKPTELRIRNLVYIIKRGCEVHLPIEIPMQILQIGLFNSEVLEADINPGTVKKFIKVPNCGLSPIPLTEQWLKDFGFKQFKDYEIYYKDNFPSDFQIDKTQKEQDEKGYWFFINDYSVNIVYVHQLQNLCFALTGKEIEKVKS